MWCGCGGQRDAGFGVGPLSQVGSRVSSPLSIRRAPGEFRRPASAHSSPMRMRPRASVCGRVGRATARVEPHPGPSPELRRPLAPSFTPTAHTQPYCHPRPHLHPNLHPNDRHPRLGSGKTRHRRRRRRQLGSVGCGRHCACPRPSPLWVTWPRRAAPGWARCRGASRWGRCQSCRAQARAQARHCSRGRPGMAARGWPSCPRRARPGSAVRAVPPTVSRPPSRWARPAHDAARPARATYSGLPPSRLDPRPRSESRSVWALCRRAARCVGPHRSRTHRRAGSRPRPRPRPHHRRNSGPRIMAPERACFEHAHYSKKNVVT